MFIVFPSICYRPREVYNVTLSIDSEGNAGHDNIAIYLMRTALLIVNSQLKFSVCLSTEEPIRFYHIAN